jgi:uncharacterized membrane protein
MKYYFRLQYAMLNRSLRDFGMNPMAGYVLSVAAFAGLSVYLFDKTTLAEYLYILVAISFIYVLSQTRRNDFLKSCFSDKTYYLIRFTENTILAAPFFIVLILEHCFLSAASLMMASGVLVFFDVENKFRFSLPTPFYKRPFEFVVGFRNAFYVFFFAYFLSFMAVSVGNFNLGIFAMILIFLICFTFYTNPEDEYYVWVFSLSPKNFLLQKMKIAILFASMLILPVVASLSLVFTENAGTVFAFLGLGYLFLITVILAKYSAFPDRMNLPQGFLLAFSLWFPPLLLGVIPYFYLQSVKRLNEILA